VRERHAFNLRAHLHTASVLLNLLLAIRALGFQSVPQQQGVIEGRVTDAGSGAPLAGAEILVYRDFRRDTPLLVTTDASGHYRAEDLDPGRYRLIAQSNGYVAQKYGERARNRDGMLVSIGRGQILSDIDFRLFAAAVIAGRVLGDGNEPQVGATVAVLSLHSVRGQQRFAIDKVALTDDRGEYRLFGLRPDRYYIAALAPNRHGTVRLPKDAPPEERYGISFYPNVLDAAKASTVNVQPGTELNGADIFLMRYRTFHLRGRVMGVERGAQESVVHLEPLISGAVFNAGEQEVGTDERGVFDFSGVLPGQYVISAGFFSARGTGFRCWQPVEVQDADVNSLVLMPSSGINVQGRIQFSDRKEADLRAVNVQFHPTFSGGMGTPAGKVQADGTFVTYASADIYNIDIFGLPEDSYVESVRILDQDAADRVVDLTRFGGTWMRMDVTLNPNGGHIDGAVENGKHEPVAGATVLLIPDISHRKQLYLFRSVTTDRSGHFIIRGIVPGDYKLLAWEDVETGAWEDPEFLRDFEDRSQTVTIHSNGQESLNLVVIPAAVGQ
jgi:Carboxypeptidase regulatory-like domain